MNSRIYTLILLLVAILFSIGVFLKFSYTHEELPQGCDEFGYLQLADAISDGNTFSEHQPRPYLKGLVDTLQKEGFEHKDYMWMITPHAYHFKENSSIETINQYAPGTSFLLNFFPKEYRSRIFPSVAIFLLVLISGLTTFLFDKNLRLKYLILIGITACLFIFTPPFLREFKWVNSIAFTFGLFLSVGLTIFRFPMIAITMVAVSANFRVVNLLLLLPIGILLLTQSKNWKHLIFQAIKGIGLLIIALIPYFLYSYGISGKPFILTYSAIDTGWVDFKGWMENISFYFSLDNFWFLANLVGLTGCIIHWFRKKISGVYMLVCLLFPLTNYLFFFLHKIHIDYYVFASAIILLGINIHLLAETSWFNENKKWMIFVPALLGLIALIDGINWYSGKDHISWQEAKNKYSELCQFDIVWGDEFSGTTEYLCDNNGFLIHGANNTIRNICMNYLRDSGFSQVILLQDTPIQPQKIIDQLKENGITYDQIKLPTTGIALIISPSNSNNQSN